MKIYYSECYEAYVLEIDGCEVAVSEDLDDLVKKVKERE